jgi:CRP/FNR family cyclic AMP-dependent transcriptional regulator
MHRSLFEQHGQNPTQLFSLYRLFMLPKGLRSFMHPANPADALFEIQSFLKELPLFAGQSNACLSTLAQDFRKRSYRSKEIIFHQGDLSRSFYVMVSGKVRTYHLTPEGDETTVNILGHRQLLGEFTMIDGQLRSATAQALTACTLLEMTGERAHHHLETIPGLALAMCRQVVFKVRWTSTYAETIARYNAAARLKHLLLLYNQQFGQEIEAGKRYLLDLGLSQSDLATMIGATRGWVNDLLQKWRKRGLVEFEGGQITIVDMVRFRLE